MHAHSTRASIFEFKSMDTKFVVVDDLLGHFEACACIAADFPQQWVESDRPRFEPFLEIFTTLFVVRVLVF